MSSEEFILRNAVPADIPAIVALINRAFSVEKFFKTGERIDAAVRLLAINRIPVGRH